MGVTNKDHCPHCGSFCIIKVSDNGIKKCTKCGNDVIYVKRKCLNCDCGFTTANKFNRICNQCNHYNEGITLYEFIR